MRSLSDFWRVEKSDDRVRELTSVLQGADSLVGVMGSGVRVTWSCDGNSSTVWTRNLNGEDLGMKVFLDYSPLAPLRPPFNGQSVDEVIGYAAHEGGHVLWTNGQSTEQIIGIMNGRGFVSSDSNSIIDHIRRKCFDTSTIGKDAVKVVEALRVDNIIEDAFIDYHVGEEWPVLGEYIRWSRNKVHERRPIDLDAIAKEKNPPRNHVMNLWIACTLYDQPVPKKLSKKVKDILNFLISKSIQAISEGDAYKRLQLSVDCWEVLQKFPNTDEPMPQQILVVGKGQPQQGEGEGQEEADGKGQSGEPKGSKIEPKGSKDEPKDSGDESDEDGKGQKGDDDTSEPEEAGGDETGEDVDEGGDSVDEGGDSVDEADETDGDSGDTGDSEPAESYGDPSDKGGDEQGAPGNLDDFDIRDLGEVPEKVLEAIMDAIAHELEDLSKSVAEAINMPLSQVNAQTKKADYDADAAAKVRNAVTREIGEMRRVFDREKTIKSRHLKGLPSGKIDYRSLAKVGTGNFRVYKRRQILSKPDLAVGLLLDVSGSMGGYMDVVWMTGAVFAEALIRKPGINFMALTYTGGYSDDCTTTRICDREMGKLCLGNVTQGGGTPTGEAIASMKTLMQRMPEKKKVIIHFTDGRPDDENKVYRAVEDARKAGFRVWSIAPTSYAQYLQRQYGDGNWETIDSIHELPKKVFHLVTALATER